MDRQLRDTGGGYRHDPPPEFLLPLNILCAVLFWAAFLIRLWLLLRRREEKPQE